MKCIFDSILFVVYIVHTTSERDLIGKVEISKIWSEKVLTFPQILTLSFDIAHTLMLIWCEEFLSSLSFFSLRLRIKGLIFGAQQSIVLLCAWVEFSFYRYFRLRVHLERAACAIVGVSTADLLLSQVKGLISFPLHSAQLRDTCLEFDSLQSVQKDQSRFRRSWKQTSMDDHRAPLRSGHLETAFSPDLHIPLWQP